MTRPLSVYLIYFAFAYVGMLILFAIISMVISSAGSSGTVLGPFLAALIIGGLFVKNEKRAPNLQDRKVLTWGSFAIFILLNAALIALAIFGGAFAELQVDSDGARIVMIFLGIALCVIGPIVFFMMRWAYGGLARKQAVKLYGEQANTFD